jgi:hypothetical protein
MITCLLVGGILACQIVKTVVIVKAVKTAKKYFFGNTEEEEK